MHIHPPHKSGSDFKEHLLHFFMLFMAVVLGAVAENLRENYLDKTKEKEYLSSLVSDLGHDEVNLSKCINARAEKTVVGNKLISLLSQDKISNEKDIYYYTRLMTKVESFEGVDGALNQLQFSDGFRLIENKEIINKINDYLYIRKTVYALNKTEEEILIQFRIASSQVVKAGIFSEMLNVEKNKQYKYFIKPLERDEKLFSYDKYNLNNLVYWTSSENGNQSTNMNQMTLLKKKGAELIELIKSDLE
jgi:hypothetical protein